MPPFNPRLNGGVFHYQMFIFGKTQVLDNRTLILFKAEVLPNQTKGLFYE